MSSKGRVGQAQRLVHLLRHVERPNIDAKLKRHGKDYKKGGNLTKQEVEKENKLDKKRKKKKLNKANNKIV